MADKIGVIDDYVLGAVKVLWVDQGDGTYAQRMAVTAAAGSAGGVRVTGRSTISGTATLRAANSKRRSIKICNHGGGLLYVGPGGTTSSDGYELFPGEETILATPDAIGVDAFGGTVRVHWLEELNS